MAPNFERIGLVVAAFLLLFHCRRVNSMDCGIVNFVRPAILGGTQTIRGEWPFIAAIYNQSNYICGGTVISYRHILTAAHCIQRKSLETALLPHEIIVRLGAYNLTKTHENGVIQKNVSAIIIHPDWNAFDVSFDADIAILVLGSNITFTDHIQPVCMPVNGVAENMSGSVVGYGVRKRSIYAEIPTRITVNALNSSHCFREDDVVRLYSSERTFCGGNGDGSPDLGDSGGGYFFTPGFSWAQYGIVAAIRSNETGHVFSHSYHVYTNVTTFKDWIIENVNQTGGVVGEARMNIIMNCNYDYRSFVSSETDYVYSCGLYNIDIQGNNFETGSFVGSHPYLKTPRDVEAIHFANGTMSYLPSGFGLVFENIKLLIVGDPDSATLGTKVVRRSDLRKLRQLYRIHFYRNDIETLHEDALWDLPELSTIIFVKNKLEVLYNKTFSQNRKLFEVDFSSNQLTFLPASLFQYNPSLHHVNFQDNLLQVIDDKTFKTNRRLTSINLGINHLHTLPKRLFQNNLLLDNISVYGNGLTSIDEDLFETNVMLRGVQFNLNLVESLPRTLFRNNLRLILVDFSYNSIVTIDNELFVNNRRLRILRLRGNALDHLYKNVFDGNPSLHELDLSANMLKSVGVDFLYFDQDSRVDLRRNDCINAGYMVENSTNDNVFTDLVEFQNHVTASCNTGVSSSEREIAIDSVSTKSTSFDIF